MTVCIAAICEENTVIGASDRMITSSDIQFEPPQTKIVELTNSIVVMIAGDMALQTEIIYSVRADVQAKVTAEPDNWWNIRDVAELYRQYYNEAVSRRSEQTILSPLGLTHSSHPGCPHCGSDPRRSSLECPLFSVRAANSPVVQESSAPRRCAHGAVASAFLPDGEPFEFLESRMADAPNCLLGQSPN